ncbi:MAG: hypothetical protein IPM51_01095 [Sphingobacteriaceae bacterium]|nr:hypothetical protein [Sphingobacteriaceae bacterium]
MWLVNVLFDKPDDFIYLYFGEPDISEFYLLQSDYNYSYWVNDKYAWFVAKCFVPVVFLGGKSYMSSAIIVAVISYLGVWRLFLVFTREFPSLTTQFKWAILYVPSVIFWGSGIMKDSITFSACCIYVHGFYWFFTQKKYKPKYLLAILAAAYFLISIKPYILLALLPGSMLWFVTLRVNKIKSVFLKVMFTPTLVVLGLLLGVTLLDKLGDSLGKYSLDKVIGTASSAQRDLKQSYYGGNTFDIGDYDASIAGVMSVADKAIFATLFRPTLLDVKNIVMALSAVENTFILIFTIYLLFKLKIFRFFMLLTAHPLLMFSFMFALFFAFSVGVSISNFGTLVRLKIPCLPFFLSSLVIMNYILNMTKKDRNWEVTDGPI